MERFLRNGVLYYAWTVREPAWEVAMRKLVLILFLALILGIVLAAAFIPVPELPRAHWSA